MSDPVRIAWIAAIPGTIAAIVALCGVVLGIINSRKLNQVHLTLNSRLDQLIRASQDSGRIAERTEQLRKTSEPMPPPPVQER